MLCNGIPLLDDCNEAEQRRLKVIDFPIKFTSNPTGKYEKLLNMNLGDLLGTFLNEFFHLLVKYLKIYRAESSSGSKIETPKEVSMALKKYIKQNKDNVPANEFIKEYLVVSSAKFNIQCKLVWKAYQAWCIQNGNNKGKMGDFLDLVEATFNLDERARINNNHQGDSWNGINMIE